MGVEVHRQSGFLAKRPHQFTRCAWPAEGERLFARIWPAVSRVNDAMVTGLPAPAVDLVRWALGEMCRNFDALAKSDSRREVA